MNIVGFNMKSVKIITMQINIVNNSIYQRSRSYDNSEVSQASSYLIIITSEWLL